MKQTLLFSALLIFSLCKVHGVDTYFPCGGCDCFAYENEKCLKFINKLVTYDEAEKICNEENLQNNSFMPTLVSIMSAGEQEYLTKYIFDLPGAVDNVWIGAKRRAINDNQFVWNNGSNLDFVNWAEGNPIENAERGCVQMQSEFTTQFFNMSDFDKSAINGKWANVPCGGKNLVVCQKVQNWSISRLQKTLLDARKELQNSLEDVRKQLNNQQTINDNQQLTINNLKQNQVPIGFIYVQLPSQSDPKTLWSSMGWKDVTSEYAGLFFRVLGGDSANFGDTQEENSPRLIEVKSHAMSGNWIYHTHVNANNGWSNPVESGASSRSNNADGYRHVYFKVSGGEVRPRNKAIRIWKRTS